MVDFIEIAKPNMYKVYLKNDFCSSYGYVDESSSPTKHPDGKRISIPIDGVLYELYPNKSLFFPIYVDNKYNDRFTSLYFAPLSSMNIIRCGNESDSIKVYFKELLGHEISTLNVGTGKYVGDDWDTDLTTVNVLEDSKGKYVELTANRDGDEFTIISDGYSYFCGKILNYKALPTVTFNTLYRGNTQTVEVYFDGELVDSKYYDLLYQNKVLNDNKITIGEDVTELELEMWLKHPDFIETKLKYNLQVDYCDCYTQEDIETALTNGLSTIRLISDISLSGIILNGIKIIRNNANEVLYISDCEFNNILFENCGWIIAEDSKSRFINCTINNCIIEGNHRIYFVNTKIINSVIQYLFLVCSENCIIDNSSLNIGLIFSDDMITITNNRLQAVSIKSYYPSCLYLTGNFDCRNNQFVEHIMQNKLGFSVALLKTIPETDIDEFIRFNNFDINIRIGSTIYTGFFYSLVDDSKLHYKEL